MARPVGVPDRRIVLRALVGVLDQKRDRRAGRDLALGVLVIEDAREDFDLIRFLALGRKPALPRAALVKEMLDIAFFERNLWRAAIDDATDGRSMALAESRYSKEMAKAIVGHGIRLRGRTLAYSKPEHRGSTRATRRH